MRMDEFNAKILVVEYLACHFVMKRFLDKKIKVPPKLIQDFKEVKKQIPPHLYDRIIKDNEKNKNLLKYVKRKFKEYKREYKYIGDTKIKDVLCFSPKGEIGKDVVSSFPEFIKEKEKAVCFTYHQKIEKLMWLDPKPYRDEMKRYKKLLKEGKIIIRECNNTEHKINDVSWYSLVIQDINDDKNDNCVGSLKLFRFLVSGFVYWFPNKTNRDNIYEWMIKE